MRAAGLLIDGIEVYYPTYTPEQISAYEAYIAERHLLASSGSDSHGPHQRYPIAYPAHQSAALLERCGITLMV